MDIGPGWAALAGVILGQALILASGWIQRRWTKMDLRRGRVETRAEEAAQRLLELLVEVRELNEGNHTQTTNSDDGHEAEYSLSHRMERQILLIPDAGVREDLRKITISLWFSEPVAQATGHSLQEVSFHLFAAGMEIVGAYLRGEPAPSPEQDIQLRELERYHAAAQEHSALVDRMLSGGEDPT